MFGSWTLDLAIGMAVVYSLLSLLVAVIREAIEARLKTRAKHLALGILQMLGDEGSLRQFYSNPLIRSLYRAPAPTVDMSQLLPNESFKGLRGFEAIGKALKSLWQRPAQVELPSYIPARAFAIVALQFVGGAGSDANPLDQSITALRAQSTHVANALASALSVAGDSLETRLLALEAWYNGSMDRVSGWYKRETQKVVFALGMLIAVFFNVDSIYLARSLAGNHELRDHLVEAAQAALDKKARCQTLVPPKVSQQQKGPETDDSEKGRAARAAQLLECERFSNVGAGSRPLASESPASSSTAGTDHTIDAGTAVRDVRTADERVRDALRHVGDLGLPIGWTEARFASIAGGASALEIIWNTFVMAIGWLLTALALSLGAPFWFDVLNKLMVIRSTVKPTEKSVDEGSEDRFPSRGGDDGPQLINYSRRP